MQRLFTCVEEQNYMEIVGCKWLFGCNRCLPLNEKTVSHPISGMHLIYKLSQYHDNY